MKLCKACNQTIALDNFGIDKTRKDFLRDVCKSCRKIQAKTYYEKNKVVILEKEKQKHASLTLQQKDKLSERRNKRYLKNQYGLTKQDLEQMKQKQEGCCAICEQAFGEEWWQAHVDHCHATGKVRGLLCNDCNRGLGGFKDSIFALEKAKQYLAQQ
jgi:hypothetical protein